MWRIFGSAWMSLCLLLALTKMFEQLFRRNRSKLHELVSNKTSQVWMGEVFSLAMLLKLLWASSLYSHRWEAWMDPDEYSDEQEVDQGDESAFGLYGVEIEAEGPCGGCQGTWSCSVAGFRLRYERIGFCTCLFFLSWGVFSTGLSLWK